MSDDVEEYDGAPEALADATGRPKEEFESDLDETPLPDPDDLTEEPVTDGGTCTDGTEQISDEYGAVERHVGTCSTCQREIVDDGSITGFDHVHDELCRHIDDGTACHDFRILAKYEDGGDRRVA